MRYYKNSLHNRITQCVAGLCPVVRKIKALLSLGPSNLTMNSFMLSKMVTW